MPLRLVLAMLLTTCVFPVFGQDAANPFEGTWVAQFERAGKLISKKRIDLHGAGGWYYDVQKHYASDARGVCRNMRAPVEAVVFTATTIRFEVARRKAVAGCSDLEFILEKHEDRLVGTMTGLDEEGDARSTVSVALSR